MALEKKKLKEIPADAIMLSEEEAIQYHYKILNNWKSLSDVFAYKYGSVLLGVSTVLSGAYVNSHFRKKLKLFSYGKIASYLPICVVPATVSFFLHHELILKQLVLLKHDQCPVCLELRASAVQSCLSLAWPLILSPVVSLGLAHKYGTYSIPSVSQPLEIFKLISKLTKPVKNILFGIFVGQALLGSVVTYFEAKSIYNVHLKLSELERKLENSAVI